jgi:hypothetical protein
MADKREQRIVKKGIVKRETGGEGVKVRACRAGLP